MTDTVLIVPRRILNYKKGKVNLLLKKRNKYFYMFNIIK
jgi:hypothetical protein